MLIQTHRTFPTTLKECSWPARSCCAECFGSGRYTHSSVASFPTIQQKLSKGYSALSISTLASYSTPSCSTSSRINLGSTRNPASPNAVRSFHQPHPRLRRCLLLPTPYSLLPAPPVIPCQSAHAA